MSIQDRLNELEAASASIELSYHSVKRAHERLGLNASGAEAFLTRAFAEGMDSGDFSSRERRYLEDKGLRGGIIKVFCGYCCVFSDTAVCITVFRLPSWFGKKHYDGKKKIRDPKNYYRHYGVAL